MIGHEHEIVRTRHHWVSAVHPRGRKTALLWLAIVVITAVTRGWLQFAGLLAIVAICVIRWQEWHDQYILLTDRRFMRQSGVPETTSVEAWVRVDRITGVLTRRSVLGKMFGYGTLVIEAPGDASLRSIRFIPNVLSVQDSIESIVFKSGGHTTSPLPRIT